LDSHKDKEQRRIVLMAALLLLLRLWAAKSLSFSLRGSAAILFFT
jgi:hypothetical protein